MTRAPPQMHKAARLASHGPCIRIPACQREGLPVTIKGSKEVRQYGA